MSACRYRPSKASGITSVWCSRASEPQVRGRGDSLGVIVARLGKASSPLLERSALAMEFAPLAGSTLGQQSLYGLGNLIHHASTQTASRFHCHHSVCPFLGPFCSL